MKILVTSFEPFGGDKLNSAQEALRFVPDEVGGVKVVKRCLPVAFGRSAGLLRDAIRTEQPDVVLCLGQAGGRNAFTPERVAINLKDARIPDNDGQQPVDEPIEPDGPDAYFSTLAREFPSVRGGFLHVPYMTEQAADHPDDPCFSREDLTRGVTAAIEAIIEYNEE